MKLPTCLIFSVAGLLPTNIAIAQQSTVPPSQPDVLRAVLSALDGYLPDARAIRDMRACTPTHLKRDKDGNIKGYTVSLQLNAPTAEGGMSGRRLYYVIVRDGRGRVVDAPYQPAKSRDEPSGIAGVFGDKAARDIEACPRVNAEELSTAFSEIDNQ